MNPLVIICLSKLSVRPQASRSVDVWLREMNPLVIICLSELSVMTNKPFVYLTERYKFRVIIEARQIRLRARPCSRRVYARQCS
jgi:uncharacterized protein YuzB (UPF0349 family)